MFGLSSLEVSVFFLIGPIVDGRGEDARIAGVSGEMDIRASGSESERGWLE